MNKTLPVHVGCVIFERERQDFGLAETIWAGGAAFGGRVPGCPGRSGETQKEPVIP
ncbi:MAG: hypothetical protein HFI88_05510 [Lachnospiraceae bacterium]|nr:hypothetical protein [Lachnospiraceae bacterium]